MPDASSEFNNSATFDGADLGTKAKSPSMTENNSGRLNTPAKEVGEKTQLAGTTIEWNIRLDGKIRGITNSRCN